jgi:hypothetical protein
VIPSTCPPTGTAEGTCNFTITVDFGNAVPTEGVATWGA